MKPTKLVEKALKRTLWDRWATLLEVDPDTTGFWDDVYTALNRDRDAAPLTDAEQQEIRAYVFLTARRIREGGPR